MHRPQAAGCGAAGGIRCSSLTEDCCLLVVAQVGCLPQNRGQGLLVELEQVWDGRGISALVVVTGRHLVTGGGGNSAVAAILCEPPSPIKERRLFSSDTLSNSGTLWTQSKANEAI